MSKLCHVEPAESKTEKLARHAKSAKRGASWLERNSRPVVLWIVAAAFAVCQAKALGLFPQAPVSAQCCANLPEASAGGPGPSSTWTPVFEPVEP